MRILCSSQTASDMNPCAAALGVFDGVHLGHRILLLRAKELSANDGIESLAYTFSPHPAQALVPARAPKLIEPVEIRLERFAGMGLDVALMERFNSELSLITPETFIDDILINKLHVRHVVVGEGFSFGAGGQGTTALLGEKLARRGAKLHVIEPFCIDGERVSSNRIRELVGQGNMERAAKLLGRRFSLTGLVMRGCRRGRDLGFSTANLSPENELLPKNGVYAAQVSGKPGTFEAVVNVGTTPTFGPGSLKIEAHLLDFPARDLYGITLAVDFITRLRDEQKFDSAPALIAQIGRDIESARRVFESTRS